MHGGMHRCEVRAKTSIQDMFYCEAATTGAMAMPANCAAPPNLSKSESIDVLRLLNSMLTEAQFEEDASYLFRLLDSAATRWVLLFWRGLGVFH